MLPITNAAGAAPARQLLKDIHRNSRDLTDGQRWLFQIMREHQFGRIENVRVQAGQPFADERVKIVRAARIGGGRVEGRNTGEFEIKQAFSDLLDELARLGTVTIVKLEFRHGLPCLLETTATL